jgi:Fic family protein
VLKQCVLARQALAALKQAAELIPNQTMLINTIPLLEAKDSSEIENIVTAAVRLFQFAQGADGGADAATNVGAGAKLPQISRSQNAHGLRVSAR